MGMRVIGTVIFITATARPLRRRHHTNPALARRAGVRRRIIHGA
jgi:hypothetical protein